jgi:glycine oxidase
VTIFDPCLTQRVSRTRSSTELNGTTASLGVLMGHVFRRSSGRGWRLRKRSMELWPLWINRLQRFVPELALQTPLLQVAPDEATGIRLNGLASQRQQLGLKSLSPAELDAIWPRAEHGGLRSEQDGRVDPLKLQQSLRRALEEHQVTQVAEPVDTLERHRSGWRVVRTGGQRDDFAAVVICAALASSALLAPLGHDRPMTPVLGQALRLELKEAPINWQQWPAVLVDQGVNLIPDGPNQLLLGATVEPGSEAAEDPLALMRSLHGKAPDWLKSATVVEHWSGLRARPVERPAPLLEQLEPGLLLASGHYRNGVLLLPASAEWIAAELNHNLPITGA